MNAGDDLLVKLVGFLIKSVGFLWIQVYKLPKSNVQVCEFCGFPGGSVVNSPPAYAGDSGDRRSIPGSRRSSGERNGNPFRYSCLGNPMDRGAWQAIVRHD